MKQITITLFLVLFAIACSASRVSDNAGLLKETAADLSQKLESTHVFVETMDNAPRPNLKSYGDDRALQLFGNNKGFVILICTHPRDWRISMWPAGVVSGEETRKIGTAMASGFKRGDFAGALLTAANQLDASLANSALTIAPAKSATKWTWLWITLGIIGFIGVIMLIVAWRRSVKRERQLEEQSERRREREGTEAPKLSKNKAKEVFNQFSAQERERIIIQHQGSPYYNPSVYHDPSSFWMLMYFSGALDHNHCHSDYRSYSEPARESSSIYTPPAPAFERSESYSSGSGSSGSWGSSDSSSSSSSDSSSWSSPDSSSSSSDSSSSSSDSGGSSGDW